MNIETIRAELANVAALAAQLRAMQAATTRETELQRKLVQLEAQQADLDRAAAFKAAAVARYKNIRIVGLGKASARMDDYAIHYNAYEADLLTMEPVLKSGKQSLSGPSPELYAAVLANPSLLPPAILALHTDPDTAVRRYQQDKSRGYCNA